VPCSRKYEISEAAESDRRIRILILVSYPSLFLVFIGRDRYAIEPKKIPHYRGTPLVAIIIISYESLFERVGLNAPVRMKYSVLASLVPLSICLALMIQYMLAHCKVVVVSHFCDNKVAPIYYFAPCSWDFL
jgi:hypothetical protein